MCSTVAYEHHLRSHDSASEPPLCDDLAYSARCLFSYDTVLEEQQETESSLSIHPWLPHFCCMCMSNFRKFWSWTPTWLRKAEYLRIRAIRSRSAPPACYLHVYFPNGWASFVNSLMGIVTYQVFIYPCISLFSFFLFFFLFLNNLLWVFNVLKMYLVFVFKWFRVTWCIHLLSHELVHVHLLVCVLSSSDTTTCKTAPCSVGTAS